MEDPLEDSEILHGGEGRDVEQWLEPQNNFFVFAIACVLLSIAFHYSYLCILAQRPITLVLMMINSYSYNTNDLVFNKFQIFIKILLVFSFNKRFDVKF